MGPPLVALLVSLAAASPQDAALPAEPAPEHPDPAYLDELVQRARELRLWEDPAWIRLGHWRRTAGGGWKSEVDGTAFFRALFGKTNPQAELAATLRAFFDDRPVADELSDAQCRYPARFAFLAGRLGVDLARLPARRCPRFEAFLDRLRPRSVTLVFSSYYLNNPASAFGHTFLRLNKDREAREGKAYELLDYGVDYSATVTTRNALLYAIRGLFGLFEGHWNHMAYYYKVRQYADAESRDLWEYDLDLAEGEVAMLTAHLWELGSTYFQYWYLDENCSYHVLGALEAAAPRLSLLEHVGRAVVLPSDTVLAVFANPGLVRRVQYRPSIRTQFEARAARLSPAGLDAVAALSHDPAAPLPASFSPEAQAAALDAAVDLLDLRHGRELVVNNAPEAARDRQLLLERRSALGVVSPTLEIAAPRDRAPELGHGSFRLGAAGGASTRDGPLAVLDLRLALHDLADPPAGYPVLSQIRVPPDARPHPAARREGRARRVLARPRPVAERPLAVRPAPIVAHAARRRHGARRGVRELRRRPGGARGGVHDRGPAARPRPVRRGGRGLRVVAPALGDLRLGRARRRRAGRRRAAPGGQRRRARRRRALALAPRRGPRPHLRPPRRAPGARRARRLARPRGAADARGGRGDGGRARVLLGGGGRRLLWTTLGRPGARPRTRTCSSRPGCAMIALAAFTRRRDEPMRKILMAFVAMVLSAGGVARAQGSGGVHTHDGFFLQLDGGIGSMATSASQGGVDAKLSGTAGEFSITLGGALTPNFVIGGQLWGIAVSSPDVEVNGQSLGSASDTTLGLSGIGLNLTYYVMPLNLYLSATPSIGSLSTKVSGTTYDTKNGFALRLAVGKEWWVSDNWGIGLNVQYAHSSNQDTGTNPPTWGTNWFGAALSATYN